MPTAPVRIACFGDSLTEGYGLAPDEALPVILQDYLAQKGISADCLNFGISGDTSGDGLKRIAPVVDSSPDAAIVAFGANDCFVGDSIPTIRNHMAAILDTFKAHSIPVLLVGITALTGLTGQSDAYKAQFDAIFPSLAKEYNLPIYPDILAPYFGNNDLTLMDGMHPNAAGVEAIAEAILPLLVALIQSLDD